ncbi:MAG: hypothetical protein H7836_03925 [Magnetococcus sp. YQC-3]
MVNRFSLWVPFWRGWLWSLLLGAWLLFPLPWVWAEGGRIVEYPMPEGVSAPQSMVLDKAGALWFTEKVGKTLVRFNPEERRFTVYPLPGEWGDIGPSRLALSPQGALWFTVRRWVESDSRINLLGRFIPDREQFSLHPLPDGMDPEDLVVDGQGRVWFTHTEANRLQRFDPLDASLKGYAMPTADAYPRGMAVDKDGGIWFAEANVNRIGYFNPAREQFQEHELPTPFANPGMVTVDREGRIWFVEMTANKLGLFYPDLQRFDEVQIPTHRGMPNAVETDSEGHVWVLEYHGNRVGRFSPHEASFQEYEIPTHGSLPGALVVDSARGRVWLTESSTEAKKLAMIDMKQLPPVAGAAGSVASGHDMMGHNVPLPAPAEPGEEQGPRTLTVWLASSLLVLLVLVALLRWWTKRRRRS